MISRLMEAFAAQHWTLRAGTGLAAVLLGLLLLAPVVAIHDPARPDLLARLQGPGAGHLLGTDHLGRDLWARLLTGGQFSVSIAAVTLAISALLGTVIGAYCGWRGGLVDEAVMRLVDVLLSFPEVVVALFLIALLGPGYVTLVIALSAVGWTPFARLARGLALEIAAKDYVAAAEVLGCSRSFILARHILPNALRPILAVVFLRFGHKLITVGALSYLGLGVQPPASDWGAMLADARPYAERMPLLVVAPGLAIMATALSVSLIGRGLEIRGDRQMGALLPSGPLRDAVDGPQGRRYG